jgi:hypothetical protein
VYNLHQHIKNDTDSTDVVENDFTKKKLKLDQRLHYWSQSLSGYTFHYCNIIVIYYKSFKRHHFVARDFLEHEERSDECYKANKCDKMAYKTSIIQYLFYFAP